MITFGEIANGVWLNGWIPHDLVLSVNGANEYQMRFNVQTHNIDGLLSVIPCICEKEMAKSIYEQYRKMDHISVFGQLHTVYNPALPSGRISLSVKVLSYTILQQSNSFATNPEFDTEKQEFIELVMRKAAKIYDDTRQKPTDDEIKYWTEYFRNAYKSKKKWLKLFTT